MFSKRIIRILALCIAAVFLMACIPMSAAQTSEAETSYKRKIISVVYDNSGSMEVQSRINYAQYSLQILLSMLGSGDILTISPMNPVSDEEPTIEVKLQDGDCSSKIKEIVNRRSITKANGGTPFGAVERAVEELEKRGLKKVEDAGDVEQSDEFWLVILTDGSFDSLSSQSKLEDAIGKLIGKYSSLRTIYLGIGSGAVDLSSGKLATSASFTALKAGEKTSFVEKMQTICNIMSGRYALRQDSYTIKGNKVTLDFDKADFPFRTVSVLLQDCAAELRDIKYNGKRIEPSQFSVLSGNPKVGMEDGYSAVIKGTPYFSSGKMELVFSSEIKAENLTVTGEPALTIQPYFEYLKNGKWERTDIRYINSNLTKNDSIRVGYEIYEQANGKKLNLASIFGDVVSYVSYAGNRYEIEEKIPLVVGANEIGISVSVMGGSYSMTSSAMCIISDNPMAYRIEATTEEKRDASSNKMLVKFTVYSDDKPLSKKQLEEYTLKLGAVRGNGTDLPMSFEINSSGIVIAEVDLKDIPSGEKCTVSLRVTSPLNVSREKKVEFSVKANISKIDIGPSGDLSSKSFSLTQYELLSNKNGMEFVLMANGQAYDFTASGDISYSVTLDGRDITKYTKAEGNRLIFIPALESLGDEAGKPGKKTVELTVSSVLNPNVSGKATATLELLKSEMTVTVKADESPLNITPYQLENNGRGFEFVIQIDGKTVAFDDGIIDWQLALGGTDIGKYATLSGGGLSFIPTEESMGGSASLGGRTASVKAWLKEIPDISASCDASWNIVDSLWEIVILPGASEVDRFAIEDSDASFKVKLMRDKVWLSAEEAQALFESGALRFECGMIDKNFLLPVGKEISFGSEDGVGIITYSITRDQINPFASFMAMLIPNGTRTVNIFCNTAENSTDLFFVKSAAWSYIWRILVILLIIYLIVWFVLAFKVKSFPSGRIVTVTRSGAYARFSSKDLNKTFIDKYLWHLQRLIPWKLAINQPDRDKVTFSSGITTKGSAKSGGAKAKLKIKGKPPKKLYKISFVGLPTEIYTYMMSFGKPSIGKVPGKINADDFFGCVSLEDEIEKYPDLSSGKYYAEVDDKKGKVIRVIYYMRTNF